MSCARQVDTSITHLVNLGVDSQMQVLMDRTSAVDIAMGAVGSATGITVDPLEPVFCTVTSDKILEIVGDGNALALGCLQKVLLDGVGIVSKGDLDGTLETVNVTVVAGALGKLVEFCI